MVKWTLCVSLGVVTSLKGVARRMNITGLLTPTHATKGTYYTSPMFSKLKGQLTWKIDLCL